ncbi:MAG: VOC family protein [Halobacteriales archaeon]
MIAELPSPRLFHLQYNVPDVDAATAVLTEHGLTIHRRVGFVDGDRVVLRPDESIPEEFEFALQTMQVGYVTITLAEGPPYHCDHIGLYTDAFDAMVDRARDRGWTFDDDDPQRPFIETPWSFRIEVHSPGDDVESTLGDWPEAHVDSVTILTPDQDVRVGLLDVLGSIPGLAVRVGDVDHITVPRFSFVGAAVPGPARIDADSLLEPANGE